MSSALDGANLGVGPDMHVADQHFADDICPIDHNKNYAQTLLDKVTSEAAKTGIQTSIAKTKLSLNDDNPIFTVIDEAIEKQTHSPILEASYSLTAKSHAK